YDGVTVANAPRLLVSDRAHGVIIGVDVGTGQVSTVFGGRRGAGESLVAPGRMKLDAERGRLLVVDGRANEYGGNNPGNQQTLLAIDLATGDRTVLSSPRVGSGFLPVEPYSLAF